MKKTVILYVTICLLLSGCKIPKGEENVPKLVLAAFEESAELNKQIALFNQSNTECHIEVRYYNRYEDGDGIQKLQREIVSGEGPDIINFGSDYMLSDIVGQYTEDLRPYLKKMSQEESLEFWDNLIQAFSYDGKLYALPTAFALQTYVAREDMVGKRSSWRTDELIQCYVDNRKNEEFMLYPGETKKDVFGSLLLGSIDDYVDWEEGSCSFDGKEFQQLLDFANQFPDSLAITDNYSPLHMFQNGKALLYPLRISSFYDVCAAEIIMGAPIVYVGYPVSNKELTGNIIAASSDVWAISSTSNHKEAAWNFISQFFQTTYQQQLQEGLPVNKAAFENKLQEAMQTENDEKDTPVEKAKVSFEGEQEIPIYQITQQQGSALEKIVGKATIFSGYDRGMHEILLEESESYFAGDKTMEETAEVMQKRVALYMNEKIR